MFIRRRKHNRSLASILLVAFVFSSVISQSSAFLAPYFFNDCIYITKNKSDRPTSIQSPFEKSEKEEKQLEEETPFVFLLLESLPFAASVSGKNCFYTAPQSYGDSGPIPLYLFIRALLI